MRYGLAQDIGKVRRQDGRLPTALKTARGFWMYHQFQGGKMFAWFRNYSPRALIVVLVVTAVLSGSAVVAGAEETGAQLILETQSHWRCHFVWQDELLAWESGEVTPFRIVKGKEKGTAVLERVDPQPDASLTIPANWTSPTFADGSWIATPGPILHSPYRHDLAAIYLRGKFEVVDPAQVNGLTLSLLYRGGVAVYLNGKEVVRRHLPRGKLSPDTPAEGYPLKAYLDAEGELLTMRGRTPPEGMSLRERIVSDLTLPTSALRQGINVLAVELHRAPTAEVYHRKKAPRGHEWSMLGFASLELWAGAGSALLPNVGPSKKLTIRVGNPLVEVWDREPADLGGRSALVSIAGARNGAFSGVVIVQSAEPIERLKVLPGDLKQTNGTGKLSASACRVRYGLPGDPAVPYEIGRYPEGARFLGVLSDELPRDNASLTVPVWLTVRVGRDAKPGLYKGKLSISVNRARTVEVPVELSVADYPLPNPQDFVSFVGLMESPESVALQYGVPMWSEAHWKLLDRVFASMARVGVKSVYIPLIGHTNMGNEESMVRWIKEPDGSYKHDFSSVERYLDLTLKHLGKIPVVCFYVWTPAHGGGSWGKIKDVPKNANPMFFTLLDETTREAKAVEGPDWGTPESIPFWQPVFAGLRQRMTERGLLESMAVGLRNDHNPSKQTLDDLAVVAPNIPWVSCAHGYYTSFAGMPTALASRVWGSSGPKLSTDPRKSYGWQNKIISPVFPRYGAGTVGHIHSTCPLGLFHACIEGFQAAGYDGVNRMGVDFWPVVKDQRGRHTSVVSRHSYRNRPGSPTMTNATFLYPAEAGPLETVRFEALRLGVQEAEARIFIEKALTDDAKHARLGEDLASRAQELLDERVTLIINAHRDKKFSGMGTDASWLYYAQGAQRRARQLFRTAAEVVKALGAQSLAEKSR